MSLKSTLLAASFLTLFAGAATADVGEACRTDLAALPDFLRQNDAGAHDRASMPEDAYQRAWAALASVKDDADCLRLLRDYLAAFRSAHIGIASKAPMAEVASQIAGDGHSRAPSFKVLSPKTALLLVPSFHIAYAEPLVALLKEHHRDIVARPNLIIDIRTNDGGSDFTFSPLADLVGQTPTRSYGAEFLATEDNAKAFDSLSASMPAEQKNAIERIVGAMRQAPPGSYTDPFGSTGPPPLADWTDQKTPRRIGILIDFKCGSSCEEFLLLARQSFKVKLFGRPTRGALDYSNLVPHTLPSGEHILWYATSRSRRLPELPVDRGGIQPDQLLKKPADEAAFNAEIDQVRDVLEAGN